MDANKSDTKQASSKRSSKTGINKLYDLATAFWASGTVIAAVKLALFTKLGDDKLSADAIARKIGGNKRWTEKLLIACASLGLLEKDGKLYKNSPVALEYLVEGKACYQGDFLLHLGNMWNRFATLDQTIKTGIRNEDSTRPETSRAWILSSHNIAMSGQAEALAKSLKLKGYKRLCDIGGGPGTYSAVLCLNNPDLQATVLEDPEVVPVAQELILKVGLQDRITVKPFQLLFDSYGEGYDLLLLSGVLHGMTEANCKKLLRKAFSALEKDGLLVVQELLLDDEEPKPVLSALFSLNMTLGASYSASEIMQWIYETGFVKAEVKELKDGFMLDHIITAKKP